MFREGHGQKRHLSIPLAPSRPTLHSWCEYRQPFPPSVTPCYYLQAAVLYSQQCRCCTRVGGVLFGLSRSFSLDSTARYVASRCEGVATSDPAGSSQCPAHKGALAVPLHMARSITRIPVWFQTCREQRKPGNLRKP